MFTGVPGGVAIWLARGDRWSLGAPIGLDRGSRWSLGASIGLGRGDRKTATASIQEVNNRKAFLVAELL